MSWQTLIYCWILALSFLSLEKSYRSWSASSKLDMMEAMFSLMARTDFTATQAQWQSFRSGELHSNITRDIYGTPS